MTQKLIWILPLVIFLSHATDNHHHNTSIDVKHQVIQGIIDIVDETSTIIFRIISMWVNKAFNTLKL